MEPSCVRQDLIPGTSKLFADYLYDFERVAEYYAGHFSDPEALIRSAQQIQYPDSRRAQLIEALRLQNGDSASLTELSKPGTVAVVTGQQVGLFSGPAYTIFKALTAVALAAKLRELGVSAVPVFWLATEDHDLAEVDHAWIFDQQALPRKISALLSATGNRPVGNVALGEVPTRQLREALGELPYADEVVDRVEAAYFPGATLGQAFRSFLQDILKDFGLLFLDPLHPEVRTMAAPFLENVVENVPELVSGLRSRSRELNENGYHAQVLVDEDASLLFMLSDGSRTALRFKDGQFMSKDRSYSPAELKTFAEHLSPNALLRPVMQDFLLPTVSYVAGPAEVAYLAQSQILYHKLLGRMPIVFPRNSFTLLGSRGTKLLDRYGLNILDLMDHQEKVKSRLAAKLVPAKLSEEFDLLRGGVTSSLEQLASKLSAFDPTLEAATKKSSSKILYQLNKLSQKTAREAMLRDHRAAEDASFLMNLVYPHRRLQERLYSIVPFLAKHGFDLPRDLFQQVQLTCSDHMVRTV